jgi:aminomethyltransferase
MVPFAGYDLPVQYTGVIDEHRAVRTRAGLFDVSHMGEVVVTGPGALAFLQRVTCNDVARLSPGRAHYSGLMLPNGAFVDDLLVYHRAADDYLLVVNAANRAKDVAYLREHADGHDVEIRDESDDWGQIAIQGPRAEAILQDLVDEPLAKIRYYRFATTAVRGVRAIVSRTGYTGEDGFEIYAPAAETEGLWYALLGAGGPRGLVPAGLGARDTLRLEARMALYGNDIDETTTALEADLGWIVKFKKGEFVGRDALAAQRDGGLERKLVGFEMEGRVPARHGYPALRDGVEVGRVTSGAPAPSLGRNIGLAYLPADLWKPGSPFEVGIRNRRERARAVETPFYRREQ